MIQGCYSFGNNTTSCNVFTLNNNEYFEYLQVTHAPCNASFTHNILHLAIIQEKKIEILKPWHILPPEKSVLTEHVDPPQNFIPCNFCPPEHDAQIFDTIHILTT